MSCPPLSYVRGYQYCLQGHFSRCIVSRWWLQFKRLKSRNACISILYQHLRIFPKPLTSPRGPLHSTLTVTLTARLNPDNTIDKRVVDSSTGLCTKPSRSYITPFTLKKVSILAAKETTSKTVQGSRG